MTFIIRNFEPHEYEMVRLWGKIQNFDRGIYDFEAFKELDKKTFWIGELDGEPIAAIGVAQYSENFALLGLYIVLPQHRGNGYGIRLWDKALEQVKAKNVGLECGNIAAEPKYISQGFKTFHKNYLYTIEGTGTQYTSACLVDARDIDFDELSKYDQGIFPGDRRSFLKKWINFPQSKATVFVRNDKIEGYGVVRVSNHGCRIGPLFADSYKVAEEIFKNLIGSVQFGKRIRLDVPSINEDGIKLAQNYKMVKIQQCLRMYTKEQPFQNINAIFGMTSLQMG